MTGMDPWASLEEIGRTRHLAVWSAVLELEGRGAERINSTSTRATVAEVTGEVRTRESVLTSLDRLTEAGVLESSEMKDWRGGHDWRTTERGRRIAEAFVREWGRVLEIGDISKADVTED